MVSAPRIMLATMPFSMNRRAPGGCGHPVLPGLILPRLHIARRPVTFTAAYPLSALRLSQRPKQIVRPGLSELEAVDAAFQIPVGFGEHRSKALGRRCGPFPAWGGPTLSPCPHARPQPVAFLRVARALVEPRELHGHEQAAHGDHKLGVRRLRVVRAHLGERLLEDVLTLGRSMRPYQPGDALRLSHHLRGSNPSRPPCEEFTYTIGLSASRVQADDRTERAAAERRRADKLSYAAETIGEREPCRDIAGERNRLREAAGRAAQRADVLEGMIGAVRRR
jgi:hypothetical protein